MKKLFSLFIIISAVIAFSCKDNSTGTTGGIGGIGGGGGGGGVTFTVSLAQDNQQQYYFEFKPSTGVVITSITVNCAAAGVNNQNVPGDGTSVFNANQPAYIGPVTGLAVGQKWDFTIAGKIGSSTGAAYSSTASLTIQ